MADCSSTSPSFFFRNEFFATRLLSFRNPGSHKYRDTWNKDLLEAGRDVTVVFGLMISGDWKDPSDVAELTPDEEEEKNEEEEEEEEQARGEGVYSVVDWVVCGASTAPTSRTSPS